MRYLLGVVALAASAGCSRDRPPHAPSDEGGASAFQATGAPFVAAGASEADTFHVHPLTPMTGDVEILLGHPDSAGRLFVMRIRELPGTVVPPHSHPVDEHITVVSGTWYVGVGEQFDSTALQELPTGAYAFAPAGTTMFAYSPTPAVVQIHGIGPFRIRWRHGARRSDEPGADSVFRFRAGQRVVGPWGAAQIVIGYASGALIQYEIETADGQRYMAHQHDLRAP